MTGDRPVRSEMANHSRALRIRHRVDTIAVAEGIMSAPGHDCI